MFSAFMLTTPAFALGFALMVKELLQTPEAQEDEYGCHIVTKPVGDRSLTPEGRMG